MADALYWFPVHSALMGSSPVEMAADLESNVASVIQAFDVVDLDAAANIINGAWPIIDAFMSR
jgi:hypothetical protein